MSSGPHDLTPSQWPPPQVPPPPPQPPQVPPPYPQAWGKLTRIGGLSTAVVVLLRIGIGLSGTAMADDLATLYWLKDYDSSGLEFWNEQPVGWSAASALAALLTFLEAIATIVVWIVWQFHATRNVRSWGVRTRRGPGWAIGGWFVPIINLWFPAQGVHDVLRGSRPSAQPGTDASRLKDESVIGWWWATFLMFSIINNVGGRAFFGAQTNGEWSRAALLDLLAMGVSIPAALLAIHIVTTVRRRQMARMAW